MKANRILNNEKFDVLNPFNGEIVQSVVNMSRSQVHEVLGNSLDFQCNLSVRERNCNVNWC